MSCADESLGCRFVPFRDVVCSSSRVQMSKKMFLDISTLVRCEKGLRREYKIRFYLRKIVCQAQNWNSSCSGGRVWKPSGLLQAGVLICRQLIERKGDYQLFKKESAQKGYKSDLSVCWLICMWFRWLVDWFSWLIGWSVGSLVNVVFRCVGWLDYWFI
jgi:hypothetical protein